MSKIPDGQRASAVSIDEAAAVLKNERAVALTGAGISTESGIPGYRGSRSVPRTPMTITQFLADPSYRARYWAGSLLGWKRFSSVLPNSGHRVLATLEQQGHIAGILTQNVDGLHHRAGSRKVVELHGGSNIRCIRCGQHFSRESVAQRISEENPWLAELDEGALGPDGDVEVTEHNRMKAPSCTVCHGMLRPDIVYFGEFISASRNAQAAGLITSAGALLVVGSSLAVNSGIRMINLAKRQGKPVVIVNLGETKGDSRATVKIDAEATSTLSALAERLG